ncbi:type IV pilin [Halomicroarcula sp. GCM10025709]|uniref:DUF7289 family protein n=1 Tax=Haloarcula TaxID=2237 RepID=UPI0024C2DA6C|nr:type IV pilin [Halomicroarcula sp. YJ-61-S]
MRRAQSHVVGVVLLLGLTVLALGGLTATVGTVIDGQTATADATRVADTFRNGLEPVAQTGPGTTRVQFTDGRLTTAQRDLRVLNGSGVVRVVRIDALIYTAGGARAAFVAGAVTRGQPGEGWLVSDPPVTVTRTNDTLVVGAPRVNASGGAVAGDAVTARVRTNVTHTRERLPSDDYRVAIETRTPEAFGRYFRRIGLSTTIRDIDGDGTPSVVASVGGRETVYLIGHDMRTEVAHG